MRCGSMLCIRYFVPICSLLRHSTAFCICRDAAVAINVALGGWNASTFSGELEGIVGLGLVLIMQKYELRLVIIAGLVNMDNISS